MDMDEVVAGGIEVAEHAITEVARSESNWAAVILVIVVIGTLALVAWGNRVRHLLQTAKDA